MDAHDWLAAAAGFCAALLLTLALAARLTPRHWWRRPNLRAFGVLGGGTLAFGALFVPFCLALSSRPSSAPSSTPSTPARMAAAGLPASTAPGAGAVYRVVDELNLRSERGVGGRRLAVLPAGTPVAATGAAHGDWWQIRATVDGRPLTGWASSLWLRRDDEARREPLRHAPP